MKKSPYRGKGWSKISLEVLTRDKFTCRHCGIEGTRKELDCHHIIPYRLFKNMRDANAKINLLTLCKPCHSKADNEYWAAHPELFSSARVPYPKVPPRPCALCGVIMKSPSPAQKVCKKCLTKKCDVCGKVFVIGRFQNDRTERFCSRECNQVFRKQSAIYPRKCLDCGKPILASRYYCRPCWLKDPAGRVRPGRKAGRRPKDHPGVSTSAV